MIQILKKKKKWLNELYFIFCNRIATLVDQ